MPLHTNLSRWTTLLLLALFALSIGGCASSMNKEQVSGTDEEAYIDFKQGFSLVVPSTWQRKRIPVSSPQHRVNTVEWLINSATGSNTFQIKTINHQNPIPPQEYLAAQKNERFNLAESSPQKVRHPAGPAARWEFKDKIGEIILLTIEGPERTYIITGAIAAENSKQILPTVEKVISSFSIL